MQGLGENHQFTMLTLTNCIVTAYCIASSSSSHNKCADNKHYPTTHHTIALGDRSLPLGSKVVIDGLGSFIAQDRMNKRFSGTHRFDIFVGSLKEAKQFGIKHNQTVIIYENK